MAMAREVQVVNSNLVTIWLWFDAGAVFFGEYAQMTAYT